MGCVEKNIHCLCKLVLRLYYESVRFRNGFTLKIEMIAFCFERKEICMPEKVRLIF